MDTWGDEQLDIQGDGGDGLKWEFTRVREENVSHWVPEGNR